MKLRHTASSFVVRVFALGALHLLAAAAYGSRSCGRFDYASIEQEAKKGAENHVEFEQVADTPIVYRASGVWNVGRPAAEVARVALDFASYSRIFHYVYRCDRVTEPPNRLSPLGTIFVEGRAAVARVWSIGNIDTVCWVDSSHFRLFAHQNEDRLLEARFGKKEKGWINFRTNGVRLAAFVDAAGKDSCRIGIVAQGWVTHAMPKWLVRMGLNIILPRLMKDLEIEAGRRADRRTPAQATWYGKWYQEVRGHFFPNSAAPNPAGKR